MNRPFRCAILLFLVMTLPMTALAHPGKTDSKGGHTDWSTGEYHYHHGYSAHQHYDMDGDGKADCPYDFKDATDHRSGSSNSGNSKSNYITSPTTSATEPPAPSTAPAAANTTPPKEEAKPVPAWIYWCFGILLALITGMWLKIRTQKEDLEIMQNSHSRELDHLKKKHQQQLDIKSATDLDISKAREELEKIRRSVNIAEGDLQELRQKKLREEAETKKVETKRELYKRAPIDITFATDGKPVFWKPDRNKPYGDYTVYVKRDSVVYHTDRFCASYLSKEAHIFDYISSRRPCMKCAKGAFDFTEVPQWYFQSIQGAGPGRASERAEYILLSGSEENIQYYGDALKENMFVANDQHILFDDDITIEDLEAVAFEMDTNLSVAKRIINLERGAVGSPLIK